MIFEVFSSVIVHQVSAVFFPQKINLFIQIHVQWTTKVPLWIRVIVTSEKPAAAGSVELTYVPRFLDGHALEVAVVGVQHHRGDLIH